MAISGIGGGVRAAYGIQQVERREPAAAARPAPAAAPAADVPAGSDPQLWAVLTSEEKAFFLRRAELGPLSYGPGAKPAAGAADAPLGLRVDLRA